MSETATPSPIAMDDRPREIRSLTPESATVFEGTFSLLHCAIKNEQLYRAVFAVLMFPITYPDRYISLRYTGERDKVYEIGIIENLAAFPEKAQQLIRASLAKHYHEQIITRVHEIKSEYGMLFCDVETTRGRVQFIMPWRQDRAEDYGERGKVLLDALDNRYIVPDLMELPPADRRRFTGYIYW